MPSGVTNPTQEMYRQRGWWPGENLDRRYRQHMLARPDALALADSTQRALSHSQLWELSGQLADCLQGRGVSTGDIVMLFLPNRIEWQIALLAVLRLHAVPASIPTKTDPETLAYAIDLVNSKVALTSATQHGNDLLDAATASAEILGRDLDLLCVNADGSNRWLSDGGDRATGFASDKELDHIMFTSSTIGLPKAVMHTADTLAALNILFAGRFSLDADTPIFMGSPLGHSVGGIHGARLALHTGAALILQESWDAPTALQMISEHQCSFTAAATPFLKDLIDASSVNDDRQPMALEWFLCGGAPVPPALLERAWNLFPNTFVTNLWGMTEGGLVTCTADSPKEKLISTAGIGLPGLELVLLDEQEQRIDTGEGELAMRGPGVFVGYYGQDELYRSSLTNDGYFRTGDLAVIDDDDYVQITGRLKDLIIRGGVNISPLPIEDVLSSHPQLKSVAVIGFPDERLGERICAVVEATGKSPGLQELIQFSIDAGLTKCQLPEVIRYIDSMPRTAAGKIRKPILKRLVGRDGIDQPNMEIANAD